MTDEVYQPYVASVHVCSNVDQSVDRGRVFKLDGGEQGRPPLRVSHVHVGLVLEQKRQDVLVFSPDRGVCDTAHLAIFSVGVRTGQQSSLHHVVVAVKDSVLERGAAITDV